MPRPDPDKLAFGARLRALVAMAALGLGFVVAREAPSVVGGVVHSALWFGAALVLGGVAIALRGRACAAAMTGMTLCLGAGWFTLRLLESPPDRLALPPDPDQVLLRVEGVVVEPPREPITRGALARFDVGERSLRLVLSIRRVAASDAELPEWRAASGRLLVYVAGGGVELEAGDHIRVSGMASSAGPPTNPGQSDARLWAAQSGVVGRLSVASPSLISPASGERGFLDPFVGAARQARGWLSARAGAGLEAIRDPRARALAASLLLGAPEEEGTGVTSTFQRLGLAHVLAISGVHVALLAWATLLGLRLLGDFGAIEPTLAGGVVVLYMLIVPAEAPVIRSGIMVLALMIAQALGRRHDGVVVLIWTAALLLLLRPLDLWSLGFQLSFGVTGVLLAGGRAFHERVLGPPAPLRETTIDRPWRRRVVETSLRSVTASVLAWGVASPWIAARVGLVTPLAPLSSLVVAVPVSILMLVGFVALLASMFIPGGGQVWSLVEPLARATLACVDWLDALPASSLATGSIPATWGGAASAATLWLLTRARWRSASSVSPGRQPPPLVDQARIDLGPRGVLVVDAGEEPEGAPPALGAPRPASLTPADAEARAKRGRGVASAPWRSAGVVLVLLSWLGVCLLAQRTPGQGVAFRLDTLDVGDATCHLLRSGGEAWLWDCGSSWAGAGEVQIPNAVRALGAPPVTTAVITHANFDHFNCLPDVAWRLGIRRVLVSPLLTEAAAARPDGAAAAMLDLLASLKVQVVHVGAGDRFRLGDSDLEFLWPTAERARGMVVNDQSLVGVIMIQTEDGPRRVLLTGDIQSRAIASLLGPSTSAPAAGAGGSRGGVLGADVLELPHHGALTRDAADFVKVVAPTVVVQSTGRSAAGLARATDPRWAALFEASPWLCTARDGASWVRVHRDGRLDAGSMLGGPHE